MDYFFLDIRSLTIYTVPLLKNCAKQKINRIKREKGWYSDCTLSCRERRTIYSSERLTFPATARSCWSEGWNVELFGEDVRYGWGHWSLLKDNIVSWSALFQRNTSEANAPPPLKTFIYAIYNVWELVMNWRANVHQPMINDNQLSYNDYSIVILATYNRCPKWPTPGNKRTIDNRRKTDNQHIVYQQLTYNRQSAYSIPATDVQQTINI